MITVEDARLSLKVDASNDELIAVLITEATATLGRELNRYLGEPREQVDLRCGGSPPGYRETFLSDDPQISEETPLTVETRATPFEAFEELDPDLWALVGLQVLARTHFPPGRGTVRLTYTVGFETGSGPEELKSLVRRLVKIGWDGAGTKGLLRSETIGDYSYTRGDLEALTDWRSVVNRWRRRLP
jgi:hypothetical protein